MNPLSYARNQNPQKKQQKKKRAFVRLRADPGEDPTLGSPPVAPPTLANISVIYTNIYLPEHDLPTQNSSHISHIYFTYFIQHGPQRSS